MASFAPSRRIEPFPNCFSIWPSVCSSARARSFSSMRYKAPVFARRRYVNKSHANKRRRLCFEYTSEIWYSKKNFCLLDPVIGSFFCDDDVVHVALAQTGGGDANEARFGLHLLDRAAAAIT